MILARTLAIDGRLSDPFCRAIGSLRLDNEGHGGVHIAALRSVPPKDDWRARRAAGSTSRLDGEPTISETNHDRMAPPSFWRWQRCCAANCSQPPCSGTLNRGRSRYTGYKRRLLRWFHHKHFRWRAF